MGELLETPVVARLQLPMAAADFVTIVRELAKRYDGPGQRLFIRNGENGLVELVVDQAQENP